MPIFSKRCLKPVRYGNSACKMLCLSTCLLILGCGSESTENASAVNKNNASNAQVTRCSLLNDMPINQHMVTSWRTAPTDALITHPITALTVRQFFAPHRQGEFIRLRLSNRYSNLPVTFENIHIAREVTAGQADLQPNTECRLTVSGQSRITIPAGESIVTDIVAYPIRSFERVGISFYAPTLTPQVTRHLNANEILYLSSPGDYSSEPSGASFQAVPDGYASNFLAIEALEVLAPNQVSTIVTVGDSITDGSESTTHLLTGSPSRMTSTDQRYPNHLQRRINAAGMPFTVANAGIGGNELLSEGWLPQFGQSLLKRFDYDVLAVAGASHVLVMIGTNDFGNPGIGLPPTPDDIIEGLRRLIDRAHTAGLNIILGTIPPAEGAVVDGLPIIGDLPIKLGVMHGTAQARQSREAVNAWLRQQTLSDGVVDFDACLADPDRPEYLAAEFNSGDNLHPNPAGYMAMAACIDLKLLHETNVKN